MSPSMKSKSKRKVGKDQRNTTPTTNGTPATAYNPVSGTHRSLETTKVSSDNSHFQKIGDTYEHPSSLQGTVSEIDLVSNNDNFSGESEDPKEKVGNIRQDSVPGSGNDRREKIRLKNERKHQRQRERRAQDLHNRCCGYLMSRKLESHVQLLVSMGFSSDRAMLALMLNDGKVEESVSWLFEASEAHTRSISNVGLTANLKIDVSQELVQISDMETRYNCSKQEVERLVVACEGDLLKAEDTLKSQNQESSSVTQLKPEEESAQINDLMRLQGFPSVPVSTQPRQNEGDFNNTSALSLSQFHLPLHCFLVRVQPEHSTHHSLDDWNSGGMMPQLNCISALKGRNTPSFSGLRMWTFLLKGMTYSLINFVTSPLMRL
ncbi:unnamed protein product [Sphenostylis stenocarpa]|uniref:UBA domain-containing protein n=1 Tax=Sphenostylis stenocarpa TaxID=92480 RepID=A0AA86T1D8_9FABA|nr:unnamed protein product [Sphenostylis stenocarpa]